MIVPSALGGVVALNILRSLLTPGFAVYFCLLREVRESLCVFDFAAGRSRI